MLEVLGMMYVLDKCVPNIVVPNYCASTSQCNIEQVNPINRYSFRSNVDDGGEWVSNDGYWVPYSSTEK